MAFPMMAGTAVHTLYVIVDTAFIGTLGTSALAAVTLVGPLFFVMVTLTMGLSTAVTALVAQAVGRQQTSNGDAVAGTALTLGVGLGLLLTAGGWATGPPLLHLLGASGETHRLAWQYFQVICGIVPFFFISAPLRAVLTGEGDARTPTLVLTGSTVINLSADALFIFGLGLGVRGAALATALAQFFSLTVFAWLVWRRRNQPNVVHFSLAHLVPTRSVTWRITRLAVPTAAGMLVMSVGAIALNRVLAEFGEVALAAYGAASKVDMIVAMPIFGLAGAAVAVIGMFAGAARSDLVRSTAMYTYRWSLTLALVIGLGAFLLSTYVLRIFTDNATAIAIGRTYLAFMLFAYPMMAFGMTSGRLLQGLGHGMPSLVITTVRVLLVATPVAYGAVYLFDAPIESIWASLLLGGLCSTILSLLWVRRLIWRQDPTAQVSASH
jgi:putative MATE family efflux protein